MKRQSLYLAMAAALLLCLGAADGDGEDGKGPDVYVAGIEVDVQNKNSTAVLWKNGEPQYLSRESHIAIAASVYVSGDDVFVAGTESNGKNSTAVLWKNGEAQQLVDAAKANSVFAVGRDVYVAGGQRNAKKKYIATVWKDGEAQPLTDGKRDAGASSVYVSSGDVYAAGYAKNAKKKDVAMLWKNGEEQPLTNGERDASASCVFVSGGDVCVTGFETNELEARVAMLWVNGQGKRLSFQNYKGCDADAMSVFVSGGDVYVVGYQDRFEATGTGNIFVKRRAPVLWKNGDINRLPNGKMGAPAIAAGSVFVSGGDVYIARQDLCPIESKLAAGKIGAEAFTLSAFIQKNGVSQRLGGSEEKMSMPLSVFVK